MPTILLLHGFNGGAGLWAPNVEVIAQAGFRCLAPDLPGWGETPPLPGFTYQIDELTAWLADFLDRSAPGPVLAVGHSFGGTVALHLALAKPDRVAGLVLANSAGLSPRAHWEYRAMCIPKLGEWMLRIDPVKMRQTVAEHLLEDPTNMSEELWAYMDRVVQNPWFAQTSLNWVRRNQVFWLGASRISVRHRLHEVKHPTLLLVGEADRVVDPRDSYEAAKRLPNARVVSFPGAKHWVPLDRQAEFNHEVIQFARSCFGESALPAGGE
jgi:pimeloyl-ACP methyl ester carboxylesterase